MILIIDIYCILLCTVSCFLAESDEKLHAHNMNMWTHLFADGCHGKHSITNRCTGNVYYMFCLYVVFDTPSLGSCLLNIC